MNKIYFFLIFLFLSTSYSLTPEALTKELFSESEKGVNTTAFILKTKGARFEHFKKGTGEKKYQLWSISKSITSLLFGALETKGLINRHDSLGKFFAKEISTYPEKKQFSLKQIQLLHLLTMSSGIDWNEYYEEDPFSSDVVRFLYFEMTKNPVKFILSHKISAVPGKLFHYSSADSHLLMAAMKRSVPVASQEDFPWQYLFNPLNIDGTFERDAQGVFVASSYVYMSARDLEKIAQLILNQGNYEGQQIIAKSYFEFFSRRAEVNRFSCDKKNYTYGASVWINDICPATLRQRFPKVSKDIIMLLGHAGQSVVIFPGASAYAIRLAHDKPNAFNFGQYLNQLQEIVR